MQTFLRAKWENLIMANYEIDPEILLPFLPRGVELDFFQGKTYVSLVGFLFKDTSVFKIPIPIMGTFEEVNLRFYVVRKVGNSVRRGVVFVNETVPNRIVAWVANKLYHEHYTAIPTKHQWLITEDRKAIQYQWKVQSKWNRIAVNGLAIPQAMQSGSIEEFIFEHYYGYTKVDSDRTLEYRVHHPSWAINTVQDYQIDCDFAAFYGKSFAPLSQTEPNSVLLGVGSEVSIDWKRVNI